MIVFIKHFKDNVPVRDDVSRARVMRPTASPPHTRPLVPGVPVEAMLAHL